MTFNDNGNLRFITSSGIEDLNKQIHVGGMTSYVAQHTDGSVVYPDVDPDDSSICYVVFHTYGQPDVQKAIDCNMQFAWAQTMPNGDLVGVTSDNPGDDSATITIVHRATGVANTEVHVRHPKNATANSFEIKNLFVDANGKIVPVYKYGEEVGVVPNRTAYARVAFDVYGSSGAREFSWSSDILGITDSFALSTYSYGASTFNGGMYLADSNLGKLVRVDVPSLSLSYVDSVHWGIAGVPDSSSSYVALGDSYSSGTGSFNYDLDSYCYRSTNNYAYYLSNHSDLDTPEVGSCHGAITDDFFERGGDVAQLTRLGVNTEVVTLTIGGNDVGFEEVLTKCTDWAFNVGYGCSTHTDITLPVSQRMTALAGVASSAVYAPGTTREIHSIKDVLAAIVTSSASAEIYIAGYPEMFGNLTTHYAANSLAPSGYACDISDTSPFTIRMDYADAQWLNTQADLLNTIIKNAVDDLQTEGKKVHYVNADLFDSHAICDSQASWINGVSIAENVTPRPESFHPTVSGMNMGYGESFLNELD